MEVRLRLLAWRKAVFKALVPFLYGIRFGWLWKGREAAIPEPRRILLLNGAHIGDVIIASSMLPILRAAYPSAEIGFVAGSWSRMVVDGHPDISYTHCVDHWRHNRGSGGLAKMQRYLKTRRTALQEVRKLQYDVALCAYGQFPDLLDFATASGIAVRIGFTESLFASMATHLVELPKNPLVHQGACLAELLRPLNIAPSLFSRRRSTLPESSSAAIEEAAAALGISDFHHACYRIVHMGSGDVRREFPQAFWRQLVEELSARHMLVFTGRGNREDSNIREVIRGLPNCVNVCNRLSWDGYVAAVRHAEVVYGVESMAGHVAAAVGTRCVVVYGGAAGVARWRPDGGESIVFTNHVPCAPCHRPMGCPGMACKNVRVDDVIRLGY